MTCTRCGAAAVVKRAEDFFCGKCALVHDWEQIIDLVQDARIQTPGRWWGSPHGPRDPRRPLRRVNHTVRRETSGRLR